MNGRRWSSVALVVARLPISALADDCTVFNELDRFASTKTNLAGSECSDYLTTTGKTGVSCRWTFGFRDEAAKARADLLSLTLQSCRDGLQKAKDQTVNHPDSYDLFEWQSPLGIYAISLKDKTALKQTLVFLRFEPM